MAENNVEAKLIEEVKELRNAIDGLKNVIAELRASLADLISPYASLKSIPSTQSPPVEAQETNTGISESPSESSEEKTVSKATKTEALSKPHPPSQLPQPSKKQMEESHPMGAPSALHKEAPYEKERKTVNLEELREVLKELGDVVREEEKRTIKPEFDVRRVIYVLKTIYNLRKALPKESIDNIIKLAETLGLITPGDKKVLEIVGSLVEDALKQNLTPDEQVLVLYVLLKNLGYIDRALEEEMINIVSDVIASKKRIVAAIENTATKTEEGFAENPSSSK